MKSGWKDMYFADKSMRADKVVHTKVMLAIREKKKSAHSRGRIAQAAAKRANANIGSDAEIAAYLAREPVARRYETAEMPDADE